jgi:hypothetical protein
VGSPGSERTRPAAATFAPLCLQTVRGRCGCSARTPAVRASKPRASSAQSMADTAGQRSRLSRHRVTQPRWTRSRRQLPGVGVPLVPPSGELRMVVARGSRDPSVEAMSSRVLRPFPTQPLGPYRRTTRAALTRITCGGRRMACTGRRRRWHLDLGVSDDDDLTRGAPLLLAFRVVSVWSCSIAIGD